MKTVIIGGTVSAMEAAISLRKAGHDVKLVVSSTFLGEDFTGTRKYAPLEKQSDGKKRLRNLLPAYLEKSDSILLNGQMKKQFLNEMDTHGVSVSFMTRAVGVKSEGMRLTNVMLSDKLGTYAEPCDILIDGTFHYELSHFLSGQPLRIQSGTRASLMLEYMGVSHLPSAPGHADWRCVRGAASDDHVCLIAEHLFKCDATMEDARKKLISILTDAAKQLSADPCFKNARLISTVSPMPDAEIEPPADKPFENLYLPGELLKDAKQRPIVSRQSPSVRKITCDVLVAGAGTAGIRAALSAGSENCRVCLAEFFTTLGGTRTTGGVQPPYDGNRNRLFLDMWREIRTFAKETGGLTGGKTSAASEALLYESSLPESGVTLLRPALSIGVKKEGRNIKSVLFAAPDGLYEVEASVFIDATGDADIAYLSGVQTMYGDAELSLTQNYSQFHITSGTAYDSPMADQDVMNLTERSEWTRCLRQNLSRCAPFDMVEMLTVRESRRIIGRDTIKLSDIHRARRPKDAIYDCYSDYDTHSRCFSEIGRYGVLPSHAPGKFVSVPFGALIPRETDNLLVCAKALSAEQEACAYTRMSPDIMCIGHIAGLIGAKCAKSGIPVFKADISGIQNQMYALGALIRKPCGEETYENTASMIAARLSAGDESAFSEALLCRWETLPDLLKEIRAAGAESNPLLISMVLLYYGDLSCAAEVAKALDKLNREYGSQARKDVYVSKVIMGGDVTGRDPYFKIIALTMLLAKNRLREYAGLIESVMNNTCMGEEYRLPSWHPIVRPDMHVHGNFDRMLSLAHAAIHMPDERFISPLMRLYRMNRENPNRAPVFSNAWLELRLMQAARLCGSMEAKDILTSMLSDSYSVIRQSAEKILSGV